jgi:hypothetical protein
MRRKSLKSSVIFLVRSEVSDKQPLMPNTSEDTGRHEPRRGPPTWRAGLRQPEAAVTRPPDFGAKNTNRVPLMLDAKPRKRGWRSTGLHRVQVPATKEPADVAQPKGPACMVRLKSRAAVQRPEEVFQSAAALAMQDRP